MKTVSRTYQNGTFTSALTSQKSVSNLRIGYVYGMCGMECDPELKGEGNEYDYGYRRYDPRIGRWTSPDPLRFIYPGMSPYNYAGNSPIACKDPNGQYIIFINGYTGDQFTGRCPSGREYWRSSKDDPDQFINSAKRYFGDDRVKFYDGTGLMELSTVEHRKAQGRQFVRDNILNIWADVQTMAPGEKIEIVTHSMGAAWAEGFVEELMNYPEIAEKISEIVHFSPCDGDNIKIAKSTKHIKRSQVSIEQDLTLKYADFFQLNIKSWGYRIKGIKNFILLEADMNKHPKYKDDWYNPMDSWDFHFDTKTYGYVWDELINRENTIRFNKIREFFGNGGNGEFPKPLIEQPDNWDDKNGGDGPTIPEGSS